MYQIQLTDLAKKQLKKLPLDIQKRIVNKLEFFLNQDDPLVFADTLTNSRLGQFRFRIGNYRVTFDVEEKILVIHEVGYRGEIYR